jgi:hypothetical protein
MGGSGLGDELTMLMHPRPWPWQSWNKPPVGCSGLVCKKSVHAHCTSTQHFLFVDSSTDFVCGENSCNTCLLMSTGARWRIKPQPMSQNDWAHNVFVCLTYNVKNKEKERYQNAPQPVSPYGMIGRRPRTRSPTDYSLIFLFFCCL